MASPSDPTDSSRDPATDPETLPTNLNPTQKPTVEQGSETLNLESTQRDLEAVDQQPDPSIEESKNEEDETDAAQAVTSSNYRRGGGPKKKKGFLKKRKQQEKSREKLEVLLKTLKPIPFVPAKALDFSRHEKLLKTLGIWEFLHLEFDQNIRQDLVANLVAYYSPESRCSYVNGSRVNVTRADLARALKLPKKKDIVVAEEEREVLERDESAKFVDEILETWVLLHTDDMWIMPVEVVEWGRDVKEKKLEKLDWAALLWFMVEKELKAGPELGDCFFASHLQLLIRSQKEDLLREESNDDEEDDVKEVEVLVKSPKEDCLEVKEEDDDVKEVDVVVKSPKEDCLEVKEEEDVGAADSGRDNCATDATELKEEETYVEEHMIELNLGQETVSEMVAEEEQQGPVEEQPMDVEEDKKEEVEKWSWNDDTHAGSTSHFLRHCDLSIATEGDEENNIEGPMEMGEDEQIEDLEEEETEEDKERNEGGFPFFPNGDSLHGDGMLGDVSPLRFASGLQMHGNSTGGHFLASRVDMHMAMGSGSNTNNKRQIDHENDMSYHNPDGKRMRTEEPSWDEKPQPVEVCVDQIVLWAEKARMSCAQKDRERAQSAIRRSDSSSSPRRKPRLTSTFNALIDLYGKAGRLEDAASLFSEMLKSGVAVDTVTFNTMIHICGTHGRLSEAEALLKKMEEKGVNADTKTYNILLTLHAGSGDIKAGLRYYRKIRRVGLFPDTVTHRAVLHVLCQRKMVKEVEDVLAEMEKNNIRIDEHSVPVIMEMYVDEGMIGKAKALFERFQLDCVLSSTTLAAVIDVYAEKGLWVEAESVFYGKRRSVMNDVLVYNVMIKAYGMAKLHEKALSLFKGMKNQGTWPDECTYNSLVQMLSGADLVDEAQRVLSEMMDSGCKPGCKTFSSLIASYVRLGLLSDAVDIYEEMRKAGVKPNEVVYGSLINGFAESGMVEEAIQYFKTMEEDGVKSNQIVLTSLIKAYSKVGCLEEARRVYDRMKKDTEGGPDVAASNSMLSLCAELGMVSEAETIFNDLREKGTCDVITFATMMYLYKGMGMLDEAIEVAEEMRESGLLNDCVSFNQVMACYAADGQLRECCELFREMLVERKLSLDWGTFKTVFTLLKKGGVPREAVEQLQTAYNEGKPLATSAITATLFSAMGLYAYAMDSCKEVTRDEIPLEHYAYNAVIYAYGASGEVDMALKTYMRMQEKGLKPDIVTQAYLVGVYGKAGMVEGVKRVHGWITFGELEANQSLFRAVRDAYVSANRRDLADVVKKEMSIAFEDGQEEEFSSISGEEEEEDDDDESEEDEAF